ncbi:MAG: leucine-rich repeat protein, partial [Bacteroidales bacterium]|nr:leucine-rich repeat protein [Bacteroidales bacterium]
VIPDSVTEIGVGAFYNCESLQSIVIPKGTKEHFYVLLRGWYYDLLKEME